MLSLMKWALFFCALGLFCAGGAVCLAKLARVPRRAVPRCKATRRDMARAALAFFAFALAVQAVVAVCALRQAPGAGLEDALGQFFGGIDAPHYISLARYGYQNEWNETVAEQHLRIVFFPLFPWLLRALNAWGALPWYVLGCAVQLPLFAGCGAALYALAVQNYGRRAGVCACAWALAFPGAFFFALPMTESLFLLLCLGFFLALEHGRPWLAGALGILCALARSPGALLCGAAAVWLWQAVRAGRVRLSAAYAAPVAGPVLGLLGYLALNRAVFGEWFRFSQYQYEHWGQKLGFFANTVLYHMQAMAQWWQEGQRLNAVCISLAAVACILYATGLLCAAARRLHAHHLAFGLAYVAFTMGATWLLSAPRYLAGCFVLPCAAAVCLQKRPWALRCALAALAAAAVALFAVYLRHGPVY